MNSDRLKAYRENAAKERLELKAHLEVEFGVENNPKRDLLFELAWDYGHSAGLNEVAIHYERFVELVLP